MEEAKKSGEETFLGRAFGQMSFGIRCFESLDQAFEEEARLNRRFERTKREAKSSSWRRCANLEFCRGQKILHGQILRKPEWLWERIEKRE